MAPDSPSTARILMLGLLHTLRRRRGLPTEVEVEVPPEGVPAAEVARRLDLPVDRIEAVIVNHRTHDLSHPIRPGDRAAFVPQGTPGPHRYTLGIYSAGKGSQDEP